MRRGGLGVWSGWPSQVSHCAYSGRSASGGRASLGYSFSITTNMALSSPVPPGMQDRIGDGDNAFRTNLTSGWSKKGQQFGSPAAFVTVVAAMQDALPAATTPPVAGWLGTVRLHPHRAGLCQPPPPARTLARSVFFFQCLLVIDNHRPACALAQRIASAAPRARPLKAVACFVQHLTDGFSGDVGQVRLA